uniref:hypothetical protein n=1 Tax=Nonomuraea sp. bgisy094 TaxID=3413781 RepID=UPI003EBB2BD2
DRLRRDCPNSVVNLAQRHPTGHRRDTSDLAIRDDMGGVHSAPAEQDDLGTGRDGQLVGLGAGGADGEASGMEALMIA